MPCNTPQYIYPNLADILKTVHNKHVNETCKQLIFCGNCVGERAIVSSYENKNNTFTRAHMICLYSFQWHAIEQCSTDEHVFAVSFRTPLASYCTFNDRKIERDDHISHPKCKMYCVLSTVASLSCSTQFSTDICRNQLNKRSLAAANLSQLCTLFLFFVICRLQFICFRKCLNYHLINPICTATWFHIGIDIWHQFH